MIMESNNTIRLISLASDLKAKGQINESIKAYLSALDLSPNNTEILFDLAEIYYEQEQFIEAATCYRKILKVYPNDPDIKSNLSAILQSAGMLHHQNGHYQQAELSYREAISLTPSESAIYYNIANALREQGNSSEAAFFYKKAIALNPIDADAYNNLGNVQRELGQLDQAIASYQTALQLNPQLFHAKVHLVHQKQHACAWENLDQDINQIREWVRTQSRAQISPFAFLSMPATTMLEQKQCANLWLNNRYQAAFHQSKVFNFQYQYTHSKIRIGYLSADFRLHPLASLVSELIELHDRNQFEIYAYSYGINDQSRERQRLEQAFDHFSDVRSLSQAETASKIHHDEIDILIDLTGFTQTSRTGIVAMRPAKLNVSWLGFPGTMGEHQGQPLFDYLLTDDVITPSHQANHYAEKLISLPHCYQPNDSNRPQGKAKAREDYGFNQDAFVYCCFNQSFKILPQIFDVWMRLLRAKSNAVLWLLDCNPLAKANLCKEAISRGVASERLVFAPRVSMAEHLSRHVHADLFLDTLPYNAHTTTSDALWMGLPVLTCIGETFSGRVAASLLTAVNLTELIALDIKQYETMALSLANNPNKLKQIKEYLISRRQQLPLFNTKQFVRDLESIYAEIYKEKI